MAVNFPNIIDTRILKNAIDNSFEWVVVNFGRDLELAFLPLLKLINAVEQALLATPWYATVVIIMAIGYFTSRSLRLAGGVGVLMLLIGIGGMWDTSMTTIALMIMATSLSILVGIPIGIGISRSNRFQAILLPILDIMQTMPIFVYLIPFVMLLGPGKVPALLATMVFAVPPVIRLTNLGIRQVDSEIIEAVTSFGATPRQKLLTVQLPLAMPTIMAGINQTTMMALSMVVIASMIGAGGIGYQVLQGIQRLDVSLGLFGGLGIVFLAIILDRIVQSQGRRMLQHLHTGENKL
jgi:glycine betaine/proline transport system permease protein